MPQRILNLFGANMAGRFKLLGSAVVAALAVVALGVTLVYRINTAERFRQQAVKACQDIESLKAALSGVLIDSKIESLNRNQDPALRAAIQRYYNRQIQRFRPKEC